MKRLLILVLLAAALAAGGARGIFCASGLFAYADPVYEERTVTKYHLDIGAQQVWGSGPSVETAVWDSGVNKGGTVDVSVNLTFPQEVSNVRAYAYGSVPFLWGEDGYSFNRNTYLTGSGSYITNYEPYVSKAIYNLSVTSSGRSVSISYTALLASRVDLELKDYLSSGSLAYILELMGGEASVRANYPAVYEKLVDGAGGSLGENDYGFMYFTPVVIQYDVTELVDVSAGSPGGSGPGGPENGGETPGGEQELTISGNALLDVESVAFEGHPVTACDASSFVINGSDYSARRACEEGYAENEFRASPGASSTPAVRRLSDTYAEITFREAGNYTVTLNVDTADGQRLTDVKPVEVRKTPYISDVLGGAQKQNRRQVLALSVAVYPGRPITDYRITLEKLSDGESVELTAAEPQKNGASIKTRAVTRGGDEYFETFTLEFLTKTPAFDPADPSRAETYRYTVWVIDSKGDTDEISRTFEVRPDRPPEAAIDLQDTFVREAGTDTALIEAADASRTDGDGTAREWRIFDVEGNERAGTSGGQITELVDLSFGTGRRISFEKEHVGEVRAELTVTDVWSEATLEEYVTQADRLTASAIATCAVINIAPRVSAGLLKTKEADVVILADDGVYARAYAGQNAVRAALAERNVDADIKVARVMPAYGGAFSRTGVLSWDVGNLCDCCDKSIPPSDSEFMYITRSDSVYVSGSYSYCAQPHTVYAVRTSSYGDGTDAGTCEWSYTVADSSAFRVVADGAEQYVFIRESDLGKTVVLDRAGGAYLKTLDFLIPEGGVFSSPDGQRLYFIGGASVRRCDLSTGAVVTVAASENSLPRAGGDRVSYVVREPRTGAPNLCSIAELDTETGRIEKSYIPKLPESASPAACDSAGNVLFISDTAVILAGAGSQKVSSARLSWPADSPRRYAVCGFVTDELGEGRYVYVSCDRETSEGRKFQTLRLYEITPEGALGSAHTLYESQERPNAGYGFACAYYNSAEDTIYLLKAGDLTAYGNVAQYAVAVDARTWEISGVSDWTGLYEAGAGRANCRELYYSYLTPKTCFGGAEFFRAPMSAETAEAAALRNAEAEGAIVIRASEFYGGGESEDGAGQTGGAETGPSGAAASAIADRVAAIVDQGRAGILLSGGTAGSAYISKIVEVPAGSVLVYEYDMALPAGVTGKAFDMVSVTFPDAAEAGGAPAARLASQCDFAAAPAGNAYFTAFSSGGIDPAYGGHGLYAGSESAGGFRSSVSFHMANAGYIDVGLAGGVRVYGNQKSQFRLLLDGAECRKYSFNTQADFSKSLRLFAEAGSHTLALEGTAGYVAWCGFTDISVYYEDAAEAPDTAAAGGSGTAASGGSGTAVAAPQAAVTVEPGNDGSWKRVTGTLSSPGFRAYERAAELNVPLLGERFTEGVPDLSEYITISDGVWTVQPAYGRLLLDVIRQTAEMTVTAPADKYLIARFNVYAPFYNAENRTDASLSGTFTDLSGGENDVQGNFARMDLRRETYLIAPGGSVTRGLRSMTGRRPYGYIDGIEIAAIGADNFEDVASDSYSCWEGTETLELPASGAYTGVGFADGSVTLTKYVPTSASESCRALITVGVPGAGGRAGAGAAGTSPYGAGTPAGLFSDFRLTLREGPGYLMLSEPADSLEGAESRGWTKTLTGTGRAENARRPDGGEADRAPLIYKKGQLVKYGINYYDYENDPSKRGYWQYAHTPYSDGPHPDAGRVLASPIERFYVDGKYTARHRQEDSTGSAAYDKLSNVEEITFYVMGEGAAPYIKSISTVPAEVKEGGAFSVNVEVDDDEKDVLDLTVEIFKDRALIAAAGFEGLAADGAGNYPVSAASPPAGYTASAGTYEIVCAVSDGTGTGLGSYTFFVREGPAIRGDVSHTEAWEQRRLRYNETAASPRARNVFWPGERLMFEAEVSGEPSRVAARVLGTRYSSFLTYSGTNTAAGRRVYTGSFWNSAYSADYRGDPPDELTIRFTAAYPGNVSVSHDVPIIIDNTDGSGYVRIHRVR